MVKKKKLLPIVLSVILIIIAGIWYFYNHQVAVLNPAGPISFKERQLIIFAVLLIMIVVVPVYFLTIAIALKYRETNKNEKLYQPDWDHSRLYESIWWAIPFVIVATLSVVTWRSSHSLDPFKPIASVKKPITIQVVALDWKWLFIYPENHVATINQMDIPINQPVNLYITSDSVMNSIWIPNLAGQIYAMPGMSTQLHILASKSGSYYGSSANISGEGFAGMHFMVNSVSDNKYSNWLNKLASSKKILDLGEYNTLVNPTKNNSPAYYSRVSSGLFDFVVMKYMTPVTNGVNI